MENITTVRLTRPSSISDSDAVPVPLNNTFNLKCQALYTNGSPVNLTSAKIYFTLKDTLADLDAAALIQKNSTDNTSYFSIDSATLGLYTVTIPAGELVTAGCADATNYYIDTQIITSTGAVFTHVFDTIKTFQQATRYTT